MTAELKKTDPDLARKVWDALPKGEQTHPGLARRLTELGYKPVPKATLHRMQKAWRGEPVEKPAHPEPEKAYEALKPAVPVSFNTDSIVVDADKTMEGIPQELVEALGLRLLAISQFKGLDKCEDACVKVATAIAENATKIAADLLAPAQPAPATPEGEEPAAPPPSPAEQAINAVKALSMIADAMHRITAGRVLYSVAYRNFGEGDRLSGEGDNFRAEAETKRNATRADTAKDITGSYTIPPGGDGHTDEAVQALTDHDHDQ